MKLLNRFSARVSNTSIEENSYSPFFYKQVKSVSSSLYYSLNKEQFNRNVDFSLKRYWNRAKYRATPFSLFSRLIFSEEVSQEIIIPTLSKTTILPSSEWIYDYFSKIKLQEYHKFSFSIKKNSTVKVFNHFHQTWSSEGEDKIIANSKLLNQTILELEQEINLSGLHEKLRSQGLNLPMIFLKKILDELASEGFLTTVFDQFEFMNSAKFVANRAWMDFLEESGREQIAELISRINHFNASYIQQDKEIDQIEKLMENLTKSETYLDYFSSSDIKSSIPVQKDFQKDLESFSDFLTNYGQQQSQDKKYAEDVLLFKEAFGNTKIRFNDFYDFYQQKREFIVNKLKSKPAIDEKLEKYILDKIDISEQYNKFQSIDLSAYMTPSANETQEYPTMQLSLSAFEDNGRISFIVSPMEGTLGISDFESRFEHLSKVYVEKLRKIEEEKFKEYGIKLCYINIYPRKSRYFSITPNADIHQAINLGMDENSGLHWEDIFIEISGDKFLITDKSNQHCHFTAKNMANLSFLAPEKIQDLSHWSTGYFGNNLVLFRDLEAFKEKYGFLPEVKFGNIIVRPKSLKISSLFKPDNLEFNTRKLIILKSYFPNMVFRLMYRDQGFVLTDDTDFNLKVINKALRETPSADLEILPDFYKKSIVHDIDGRHYHNEFIFNFISEKVYKADSCSKIRREFPILSKNYEWTQINFFIPMIYQNEFLQSYLSDLSNEIQIKNLNAKMFYIRYFDDRHMVRVRFQGISQSELFLVLSKLDVKYEINEKQVEIGNYSPEIIRYSLGNPQIMELAENYFCAETKFILRNKSVLTNTENKFELFFSLVSIILKNYEQDFSKLRMVLINSFDKTKFSLEFRKDREQFTNLFHFYYESSNLDNKLINLENLVDSLSSYVTALNSMKTDIRNQILSLIHMLGNRLFGIERKFEDQCLNYFFRILTSEVKRKNY